VVFRGTCDIMDLLAAEEGDFDSRISEWKMVHRCWYIKVWNYLCVESFIGTEISIWVSLFS